MPPRACIGTYYQSVYNEPNENIYIEMTEPFENLVFQYLHFHFSCADIYLFQITFYTQSVTFAQHNTREWETDYNNTNADKPIYTIASLDTHKKREVNK